MRNACIAIGQLIVDCGGLEPRAASRLQVLTERALQSLLEQRGLPRGLTGAHMTSMVLPDLSLPGGAEDWQLAEGVAEALYHALSRVAGPTSRQLSSDGPIANTRTSSPAAEIPPSPAVAF